MNPSPSTMGDIKLTYRFLVIGIISFLFYNLFFFVGVSQLADGIYRTSHIWVLAHTLILAFLIMIVMGVMYQLVPVALLVSIYSERLSRIQFWVYSIGVLGLMHGLSSMDTVFMAIFGTLAFTGVLLFVLNIFLSVKEKVDWNMMSTIIMTSVFYLFMTVLFGLLLVLDFQFMWWSAFHDKILYSHITFGVFGWFTSVITGFSYKMAPMFALAHGYSERYAKWIYGMFQTGIIAIVTGLFAEWSAVILIGMLLIIIGFLLFVWQIREMMKHKMKAKLDVGFQVAIYAVYGGAILLLFAPIGFLIIGKDYFLLPFAYLYLIGFVGFSILGYLFKIVPFLWWTDQYSDKVGKENVPMLKDMMDEKNGKRAFVLLFIGMIGNAIGMGLHQSILLYTSNLVFTLGSIWYSYLVLQVFKK